MPFWHLKSVGRTPYASLCIYRAGCNHAFQCIEEQPGGAGFNIEIALENWNFPALTACDWFFEMLRRAEEEPESLDVKELPKWFIEAIMRLSDMREEHAG